MKIELYPTDDALIEATWHKVEGTSSLSHLRAASALAVDNAVKKIMRNLPQRKSLLEACAYQGPPPKKWLAEMGPYFNGYNKCLEEIEQALKELIK